MSQPAFTLNITNFDTIGNNNATIQQFLTTLFAPASNNFRQLAYELQREFKQGGSPDVSHIRFDRVQYHAATGRGSFRIVLDVNFTFGCEDVITEKKDQTSEWTFITDIPNNTINFYSSPYAEGRSTADEF